MAESLFVGLLMLRRKRSMQAGVEGSGAWLANLSARAWFNGLGSPGAEQVRKRTMIKTKQDILDVLDQNRSHLRALGVRRIGLFGSFVRGEQSPDSDIDLLVEIDPERKTFDTFMELSLFLEQVLQHRIELVTVESLSPYLGPHILREVEYAPLAA